MLRMVVLVTTFLFGVDSFCVLWGNMVLYYTYITESLGIKTFDVYGIIGVLDGLLWFKAKSSKFRFLCLTDHDCQIFLSTRGLLRMSWLRYMYASTNQSYSFKCLWAYHLNGKISIFIYFECCELPIGFPVIGMSRGWLWGLKPPQCGKHHVKSERELQCWGLAKLCHLLLTAPGSAGCTIATGRWVLGISKCLYLRGGSRILR